MHTPSQPSNETIKDYETATIKFAAPPPNKWKVTLGTDTSGYYIFAFETPYAPNWFYRLTQRLVLGIKYTRINKEDN